MRSDLVDALVIDRLKSGMICLRTFLRKVSIFDVFLKQAHDSCDLIELRYNLSRFISLVIID